MGRATNNTHIKEWRLIKTYNCLPSELDEEDSFITSLHERFLSVDGKVNQLKARRAEQKAKLARNKK